MKKKDSMVFNSLHGLFISSHIHSLAPYGECSPYWETGFYLSAHLPFRLSGVGILSSALLNIWFIQHRVTPWETSVTLLSRSGWLKVSLPACGPLIMVVIHWVTAPNLKNCSQRQEKTHVEKEKHNFHSCLCPWEIIIDLQIFVLYTEICSDIKKTAHLFPMGQLLPLRYINIEQKLCN